MSQQIIKKLWVVVLVAVLLPSQLFADDLLDILESDGPKEVLVKERNLLVDSVRKSVGRLTAEQNIFFQFLREKKYEKSLFQWWVAFEGSRFESSPTGQALFAYLLLKNNMPVNAVESLFRVTQPGKIDKELKRVWSASAPVTHKAWGLAQLKWTKGWTPIFDVNTEIEVESRQFYTPKQTDKTMTLLKKTKLKTRARAWLEWQIALGLALKGDLSKSAKVLAHLLKGEQNLIQADLANLTAARLLYQRGFLDAAIKYYKKIEKSSEYWWVAQEELAWSFIRKGQPQDTLAITRSLMVSDFAPQVGPESVMLRSLAQLKVCDYPGVVKSIDEYRKRYRGRALRLVKVSTDSEHPSTLSLLKKLESGKVKLLGLSKHSKNLPRYVSRDEVLYGLAQTAKALELEAQQADRLYARSLSGGTSQVGFQAQIASFKSHVTNRHRVAINAAISRVQKLAQEEVKEIKRVLNKMHVVEAELIQQLSLAEKVVKASSKKVSVKKGSTGSTDKYAMRYPFEGETWFDEISNYRVDIKKGCQAKRN